MELNKVTTYDLEILRNLFIACFLDYETGKRKSFVLYDHPEYNSIEQLKSLVNFLLSLEKHNYTLLGFNCLNFDSQLIELILSRVEHWFACGTSLEDIITELYVKAQEIVHLNGADKFDHLIPEWNLTIPHIDLFKQKHYDGKAKMGTSLKWIQFTTRWPNVEEMPIHHDSYVTKDQVDKVLEYCWNDDESTSFFYKKIIFETELRKAMSEKYKKNLINASEPRLAKEIFGKLIAEKAGIDYKVLKTLRTNRTFVNVKDIILPYVKFETPDLQAILKSFENLTIEIGSKEKFEYTFNFHGIETVLGLGGIHACCKPGSYKCEKGYRLHDIDVVSFYPNLSIQNHIRPEHLGDWFSEVYENIFNERQKIPKKDPQNYVYKIILNSVFGLSKETMSKSNYLYDPKFTYAITINGQLTILMLAEMLVTQIPNVKLLQANTDGLTIYYEDQYADKVREICEQWKAITKLKLEEAFYKEMVIRDVNNYLAIYEDEKLGVKKKGLFETELEYHKNPSFLVVPKALEAYFVKGIDYKKFIYEHKDIYDFLGAAKKKSNFDLNLYLMEAGEIKKVPQQKVTRYYVSRQGGGQLVKDFNDGRKVKKISIVADSQVTPLNRVLIDNALDESYKINYVWYIKEVEKIVCSIEGNHNQILLF